MDSPDLIARATPSSTRPAPIHNAAELAMAAVGFGRVKAFLREPNKIRFRLRSSRSMPQAKKRQGNLFYQIVMLTACSRSQVMSVGALRHWRTVHVCVCPNSRHPRMNARTSAKCRFC